MSLSQEEEEREKERKKRDMVMSRTCTLKDLATSIETQVQQEHHQQSRYQDMECRNLLDLEMFFSKFGSRRAPFELASLPVFLGLIQSNPQLRRVVLASEIQHHPCLFTSTLDNCTRLELQVIRFNMDDREASELGRFLRPVSATLKTLCLVGLEGGCFDPTTIWLPQVSDLAVNVSDGSETRTFLGLQELLTRCPSLERLTISPLDLSTKLGQVATIIKNHCPKLTSFLFTSTLSSDTEICKIIRTVTPGRLLELHCRVPRITNELQNALRAHRDSLEVLTMAATFYIREPVDYVNDREVGAAQLAMEQMRFLQEVMDSFLSLRELSFYDKRTRTSEPEFYDALMYRSWKCLNLERLELFGGVYDVSSERCWWPLGRCLVVGGGRNLQMRIIGKEVLSPDYGLLRRFIRHVSPLPRLGTMKAVRVTCVRNIDKPL